MSTQNAATLFIRLLTEAYEADRLVREARLSAHHRALAERFKQQQMSALQKFRAASEPLDCLQLMVRRSDEHLHG